MPRSRTYPETYLRGHGVTLYRDDLVELFDLLGQLGGTIEIRTEHYRYASSADFLEQTTERRSRELHVTATDGAGGSITVAIRSLGFSVVTASPGFAAHGAAQRALAFLMARPRRRVLFNQQNERRSWLVILGMGLGVMVCAIVRGRPDAGIAVANYVCVSVLLFPAIAMVLPNRVRPLDGRPTQGWWGENRDKLILLVVGALVTLLATKLIPALLSSK